MPKGKNRHAFIDYRPQTTSYVHPSLQTQRPAAASGASIDDSASVTERIHFLRRVQRPPPSPADAESGLAKLRVGPTDGAAAAARWARTAGPPPPRSWLVDGADPAAPSHRANGVRARSLHYFPGLRRVSPTSLVYQTIKAIARDIAWHLEYDHVYLSIMPVELKDMLLSHVSRFGPEGALRAQDLKTLFATPESSGLADATGGDGMDRLDLGHSTGHAEPVRHLEKLWLVGRPEKRSGSAPLPESWDADVPLSLSCGLRFPALRKLSLAYPGPRASWTDLLSLAKHLGTLTHLSLAGWPMPCFSATAADHAAPHAHEGDSAEDEAIHIMRLLARETASLTYLSLADCHDWHAMLQHVPADRPADRPRPRRRVNTSFDDEADVAARRRPSASPANPVSGALWCSAWRRLQVLDLSQSVLPPGIDAEALRALFDRRKFRRSTAAPPTPNERRPAAARHERNETYSIIGPIGVVENIAERKLRQQWIGREGQALELGAAVKAWRVGAGLHIVDVEYGWGLEEDLYGAVLVTSAASADP